MSNKKSILIALLIFLLLGCKKEDKVNNGGSNFIYAQYISEDTNSISNIKIPLIIKENIEKISIIDIDVSVKNMPTIQINNCKLVGEYKQYQLYIIDIDIENIKESIVIDKLTFKINDKNKIKYQPENFIIVKTDYKIIDHNQFKLASSVLKYNNIPIKIKYQIITDSVEIINLKSLYSVNKWTIKKDLDYQGNIANFINIDIKKIKCKNPLFVRLNFQYILKDKEKRYSYIDNIVINNLNLDSFKEAVDNV